MFWNNNKENGADVIQNRTDPRVKLVFSRAPCVPGQWKSAVFSAVSQMLTNFFFLDFHGQRSLFFMIFARTRDSIGKIMFLVLKSLMATFF